MKDFVLQIINSIKKRLNIIADTDAPATIQSIERGVEFKGENIWMLFFAIIIASVGLNVNSTAVIIGAMLISPLMGPILGVGLAIGINDNSLLRKSLKNLVIMIVISLFASTCYFFISPLSDAQSELLARTRPTIFDVFIAFFGGTAGILASSRKQEKTTVVSGVAIATALMPPLCTAGYGLASGQFKYFYGAFYLFFINATFIALATFIVTRALHFPLKKYLDRIKGKRVRRWSITFAVIVLIPTFYTAIEVVRESAFNSAAIKFIKYVDKSIALGDVNIIQSDREFNHSGSSISLTVIGRTLTQADIAILNEKLHDFGLNNTTLVIKQASGQVISEDIQLDAIQKYIEHKDIIIADQKEQILALQNMIDSINIGSEMQTNQIAAEAKVLFKDLNELSIALTDGVDIENNVARRQPIVFVKWKKQTNNDERKMFSNWIMTRLKKPEIKIVEE